MKVDSLSDILLDVQSDLALRRQTRSAFSAEGNVKQLSMRGTQRSAEREGCEVVTIAGWRGRWYCSGVMLTLVRVREES